MRDGHGGLRRWCFAGLLSTWNLPSFTFAFNVAATIFLLGARTFDYFQLVPTLVASLPTETASSFTIDAQTIVDATLKGVSEVFLLDNRWRYR